MCRITQGLPRAVRAFGHGPFTLFGWPFHTINLTVAVPHRGPTTPPASRWFGLFRFRSPLLTESLSLSFPPVTEMFHFTGYRVYLPIYSGGNVPPLRGTGYPIRKSPGQSVLAALRSLSQLITSFIACWHQGIHCMLLVACSFLLESCRFLSM